MCPHEFSHALEPVKGHLPLDAASQWTSTYKHLVHKHMYCFQHEPSMSPYLLRFFSSVTLFLSKVEENKRRERRKKSTRFRGKLFLILIIHSGTAIHPDPSSQPYEQSPGKESRDCNGRSSNTHMTACKSTETRSWGHSEASWARM